MYIHHHFFLSRPQAIRLKQIMDREPTQLPALSISGLYVQLTGRGHLQLQAVGRQDCIGGKAGYVGRCEGFNYC